MVDIGLWCLGMLVAMVGVFAAKKERQLVACAACGVCCFIAAAAVRGGLP